MLIDTNTEYGSVVSSKTHESRKYLFTPEKKIEELNRLRSSFGLDITDKLLDEKGILCNKTLTELSEMAIKAHELRKKQGKLSTGDNTPHVYIAGITLPKRDYLYVEFSLVYGEGTSRPGIELGVTGFKIDF